MASARNRYNRGLNSVLAHAEKIMLVARGISEMALASNAREQMILHGEFSAGSFVPWIEAYARKLGLTGTIQEAGSDRIELHLEGPPELVDAMEVGCLLGPIDIWVETIERTAETQPQHRRG